MKKVFILFCFLVPAIFSYAINEAEIEAWIEANSDIHVKVINDSVNPWGVTSDGLLMVRGGRLTIKYETDYIIQLNCEVSDYALLSFYLDGGFKDSDDNHGKYKLCLPAGKHELKIDGSEYTMKSCSINKMCKNEDVVSFITSNSDVELEVVNGSDPFIVESNILQCPLGLSAFMTIKYEAQCVTRLNYKGNRAFNRIILDGKESANGAYIPAGKHDLLIQGNDGLSVESFSIKKISGVPTDVETMIESNSEVDVEVINDTINPLIVVGQDSIKATGSSELTIKYSSDKMTEVSWAKRKDGRDYIDDSGLKAYIDGVEIALGSYSSHPYSQKFRYHYLPAGDHVVTFVLRYESNFLVDFSIQEIEGKDPVRLYRNGDYVLQNWESYLYPKHYYSYDRDSVLKPNNGTLDNIDYFSGCINSTSGFSFGNYNNDEYVDSVGGESLDFNNDGYPDFADLSTYKYNNKHERTVRTIYNNVEVQSLVNLYSLNDYKEKIAKEGQMVESSVRRNARSFAHLGLSDTKGIDTEVVKLEVSDISKPQRVVKRDINSALAGMGKADNYGLALQVAKSAQCPTDRLIDINGDGIVEYVVSSVTIDYLPSGETAGASVAKVAFYNMGDGDIVYQIVPDNFVDLDADGVMDIIGFDGKSVVYYLLQQNGNYKKYSFGVDVVYTDFWCYDFDKDGDKDILLAFAYREAWNGSYMVMLENLGNGEYQSEEYFYENRLYKPWCGDYDNDGNYEVIWVVDTEVSTKSTTKYITENICHIEVTGITLAEEPVLWNIENFNFPYTNNYNIIDTDNDGVLEMWAVHYDQLVWKMNLADTPNTRPNKPQKPNVVYDYSSEMVSISWDLGSDKESSAVDLTYALRIGSEPGKGDILYAHAYADGTRRNMIGGNMMTNRFRVLNTKTWKPGKYYVSVQTIDPNNRGSEFSEEVVFEKTSYAVGLEVMYNIEHFGVGDTCNVLLNPNVLLDTAAYVTCTGGEIVGMSKDSLTLYVVFTKDGEQTISLCHRNANGSVSTSCIKTIDVSPFYFTTSKTKSTKVALDLNEDGYMEFYGQYEDESATTTHFHTYKADGSISRINKMFNNNTFWDDDRGPFITLDINKDGRVDVFSKAGKSNNYSIFYALNTGNLSMTVYSGDEDIISSSIQPEYDMNNDGWFEYVSSSYIQVADSGYTSFKQITCPQHRHDEYKPKDYTNDGLLDLIVSIDRKYYILYENNGDFTFTEKDTLWTTADLGKGEIRLVSDFDNDGKIDIVYHNEDSNSETEQYIIIKWGDGAKTVLEKGLDVFVGGNDDTNYGVFDYNNDGYLDMLVFSQVHRHGVLLMLPNHEYMFVPTGYKFHAMDWDARPYLTPEGNLLFTDTQDDSDKKSKELILQSVNQRPAAPTNITATQNSKGVMITWDHSVDSETPAVRMRYNISVKYKGKSGDGAYLISPCNSTKNGVHVPSHLPLVEGNRFMIPMASIPVGEYEVQVQGVDLHFLESDFSEVFNLVVRETVEIEAPAATGVGVKTTITVASNIYEEGDILSAINLDGGVVDTEETEGRNLVVVWNTPGLKTITLGDYSHTINVKPMVDANFSIPAEVMQSAIVNCSAKNAKMGIWTILANGTKDAVLLRDSEDVDILLMDTANIVLRFDEVGAYIISHSVPGEFGEVVCRGTVQVTDKDIAPEISSVTNEGEHYLINWNSLTTLPEEVIGFRVYKETSVANVYDLVAELGLDSRSYIDLSSNANVQTARYALSYMTSYGESMKGTPHQGLHVMINRGIGNSWNLAWMKYEGRDVATYRIWRGTSPENLSIIGEISGNMTSYSDLITSDSVNYYATEVVFLENAPSLMSARYGQKRTTETTSMSNIVSTASSQEVIFTSSIELIGEDVVAGKNISSQLSAYIYPYYASYNTVNWMIESGEDIATISSSGKLTANGYSNGNVVVRAYALDGSGVYGEITIKVSGFDDLFSITYKIDDEVIKSEELSYGSTIVAPSSTKEGYSIVWYNLPVTMPAKDVVVNGEYVLNSYLLTYMVDREVYDVDTVLYGTAIATKEIPVKEGYTFSGWSEIPETMPANDVIVTGTFTINSYNLIYQVDGVEYKRTSFHYGAVITLEAEPTKEGYTFSGWSEVPETMPANDIVVEGSFSINKYLLTYMVEGNVFATDSIVFGAPIELIEGPEKEGYTFAWERDQVPSNMPAHDVVISGAFTINSYNLIYMIDGVEYKRTSFHYGAVITLEAEPTKEGYTFSGWSEVPETMPANDVVVEGSFSINTYALIYIVDDELYATDSIVYGEIIVLRDDPIKDGYIFSGWSEVPETMPAYDVKVQGTFTLSTSVDNIVDNGCNNVQKVIKEKQLLILRDGRAYTIIGQEL